MTVLNVLHSHKPKQNRIFFDGVGNLEATMGSRAPSFHLIAVENHKNS